MVHLLHPTELFDSNYFPVTDTFWERLVKLASSHLVLPAICRALISKKLEQYVPNDLLSYLKEITEINYQRNKSILKQLAFLSEVFNKNKIDYVFLKGAAMLILKPYDTVSERMLGDIDILVAEKDLLRAKQILIHQGFREIKDEFNFVEGIIPHRHLKRVVHPQYIAAVELHGKLLVDIKLNTIRSIDVLKHKVKVADCYWIPSNNHLWLHAILSWQYNDNGFYFNTFSIRTFLDVVYLEPKSFDHYSDNNPAIRHFYSLSSLFINKYQNRNYFATFIFKCKLLYPKFELTIDYFTKSKIILSKIFSRLKLVIMSKIYRKRLLQNSSLIKKRIFNFFMQK